MGTKSLPPGFRFHPTDVELIMYYLKKKVMGKKIGFEVITELDIYKFVPEDLPDKSVFKSRDLEWYFFCPRERKYASGGRMNRTTESGYWKTTGKDRQVVYENRPVGQIRTLIFHHGRAPRGKRTDWVMHEYRLQDEVLANQGISQDAFVLCKVFQKSGPGPKNGAQYGAPFNEEEWNNEDDNHIECLSLPWILSPAVVLHDNQSSSILKGIVGPGSSPSGAPSKTGPSESLPSANMVVPSVSDDESLSRILDIPKLWNDEELMSMLEMFKEEGAPISNENGENELGQTNHLENASCLDGNDIYEGLGDIDSLADLNKDGSDVSSSHKAKHPLVDQAIHNDCYLELHDLDTPFDPAGGTCMDYEDYNNSDRFGCHPLNAFSGMDDSESGLYPSLDGSHGFDVQMDVLPKNVGENAKLGYESSLDNIEHSEPDSEPAPQTCERGKRQTKSESRFQKLLESIPSWPASAAEHPGMRKHRSSIMLCPYDGSSIHVKAEVTTTLGVGCAEEALSDELGENSCMDYFGCNLHRRGREFRKRGIAAAATCNGNFMVVLFLGILSAMMWIFVVAVIAKVCRFAWDLVLP